MLHLCYILSCVSAGCQLSEVCAGVRGRERGGAGPVAQLVRGAHRQPQHGEDTGTVTRRHDVIQQGIDSGAHVKQHQRHQIKILTDVIQLLTGVGHRKQRPTHVKRQPTQDEHQHDHHCRHRAKDC